MHNILARFSLKEVIVIPDNLLTELNNAPKLEDKLLLVFENLIDEFNSITEYYPGGSPLPEKEVRLIIEYIIIINALFDGHEGQFFNIDIKFILENNRDIMNIPRDDDGPRYISDLTNFIRIISGIKHAIKTENHNHDINKKLSHYKTVLNNGFSYEFSDGDIKIIQTCINELRDLINSSQEIDDNHKQRLLSRLEKLQSELHKKMSDLDRFFGIIADAGVLAEKFGNNAKPIVDRMREIAEIAWRSKARAEELPSASEFPQLMSKSGDD
jgi:hypothetical protein